VLAHDLFKPSFRLEEDVLTPEPGTSPGNDSPMPGPGAPSGEDTAALALNVDLGASISPVGQTQEPGEEIVAIIGPPSPDADSCRPISECLQLGTIPDDETETRRLAHRAKGYLIHNKELYHCSASSILQCATSLRKVRHCSSIFTRESVDIILHREAWLKRFSDKFLQVNGH
jgi:hypothetical protein